LVTYLHIGQIEVSKHVTERGEKSVGDAVPEVKHSMRFADKPAPVHDIGFLTKYRVQQLPIILRVIFQIGILNQHDIAGGKFEAVAKGGAFTLIDRFVDDLERRTGK